MRIDVKKFLFVGLEERRKLFFAAAQKEGMIHFIDKEKKRTVVVPEEIAHLTQAIKILRSLPPMKQDEERRPEQVDAFANQLVALKEVEEKLMEERRTLRLEIARVEMFGDFSKNDLAFIEKEGDVVIQFFWAKKGVYKDLAEGMPRLISLTSDHGLDYFVGINPEPVHPPKMVEIQIDEPVGVLQKRFEAVKKELSEVQRKMRGYAKYNDFFRGQLLRKLNSVNLSTTEEFAQAEIDGSLFVVEGWVPVNHVDQLNALAKQEGIRLEEVVVEEEDSVPTYLENKGLPRVGEDLVQIYDTPSIEDKDPSTWVLWAFAFFFAFIINDGGYGAVFLAAALLFRYRNPDPKGGKKRFLRLFTILGTSCFLWGILTTSFFGIQIGPDNPLRKVSLLSWLVEKKVDYHLKNHDETYQEWLKAYPENVNIREPREFISLATSKKDGEEHVFELLNQQSSAILFELALLTGVVHLICSMARNLKKHWAGIGWIFGLIGGYLYFPYYLGTVSLANTVLGVDATWGATLGLECLLGGFVGAILLAVIQNGVWGVFEAVNVVQVFGDTLSYVRLYALGLAGGILSETINEMAGTVPYFIAGALILASHAFNIVLSVMGGVIHGLRLNFLEWYHYSFEGGGRPFRPLRLLQKED